MRARTRMGAAAVALAAAAALSIALVGVSRPAVELLHLATFTSFADSDAASRVRGPLPTLPAKEDFLHAHKDDRDGFPKAAYHKGDDEGALSADLSAAGKKVKLLSARDEAVRGEAAKRAAADLSKYDSVFSSGIDEYSKISHSIDEQSRKVFLRSLTPKKPPKPAYDPLSDERKLWRKMGVKADGVFGVPREYAGWHATATANPAALKHLPDYVRRAQAELGGGAVAAAANGWHSHPLVPSRRPAKSQVERANHEREQGSAVTPPSKYGRATGSYVEPPSAAPAPATAVRAAPTEPRPPAADGAVDAQTLQSIVKAAVSKALKARRQAEAHQEQAGSPVSGQAEIVWAKAVPVTSDSPKAVRMSAAAAAAPPVAAASDFASPGAPATGDSRAQQDAATTIAQVKQMAQMFESARHQVHSAQQAEEAVAAAGAGSAEEGESAVALRRQRNALLNEEAAARPRDKLVQDSEVSFKVAV